MARDTAEDAASEEALLARYAAGDRVAARLLVERLAPRVARYATRLLGGDSAEGEDVAQEALIRLWRAAPGWRAGEARVTTWLYRVVTNLVIDRLRARTRRPVVPLSDGGEEAPDSAPLPEARLIAAERRTTLEVALASLPERQRGAVVLRHVEGLSNPEIAAILGTSVEAVESLIARAKRALAVMLSATDAAPRRDAGGGFEAGPDGNGGRGADAIVGTIRRMERRT